MTSNPKHALNGFEWDVADFLLKPIAYDRFLRAIEKVHKLNGMIKDEEFLTISSGKTVHRLKEDEILYVEGAGEYLNVVTRSGHFLVYSNMRNMLGMLNSNFVQVHRSFIVNRKNIQVWSRHKLTVGGKEIPISKTYEQNVQNSVTHVR
jgi:DNA-binding LytR/AlgR family response regulator